MQGTEKQGSLLKDHTAHWRRQEQIIPVQSAKCCHRDVFMAMGAQQTTVKLGEPMEALTNEEPCVSSEGQRVGSVNFLRQ